MEQKNNTGAIFKNENKTTDKHPEYKGKVLVNNKEMEIALWVKTSAKGVKFFSVSLSEPFVKSQLQNKPLEINNDLPF